MSDKLSSFKYTNPKEDVHLKENAIENPSGDDQEVEASITAIYVSQEEAEQLSGHRGSEVALQNIPALAKAMLPPSNNNFATSNLPSAQTNSSYSGQNYHNMSPQRGVSQQGSNISLAVPNNTPTLPLVDAPTPFIKNGATAVQDNKTASFNGVVAPAYLASATNSRGYGETSLANSAPNNGLINKQTNSSSSPYPLQNPLLGERTQVVSHSAQSIQNNSTMSQSSSSSSGNGNNSGVQLANNLASSLFAQAQDTVNNSVVAKADKFNSFTAQRNDHLSSKSDFMSGPANLGDNFKKTVPAFAANDNSSVTNNMLPPYLATNPQASSAGSPASTSPLANPIAASLTASLTASGDDFQNKTSTDLNKFNQMQGLPPFLQNTSSNLAQQGLAQQSIAQQSLSQKSIAQQGLTQPGFLQQAIAQNSGALQGSTNAQNNPINTLVNSFANNIPISNQGDLSLNTPTPVASLAQGMSHLTSQASPRQNFSQNTMTSSSLPASPLEAMSQSFNSSVTATPKNKESYKPNFFEKTQTDSFAPPNKRNMDNIKVRQDEIDRRYDEIWGDRRTEQVTSEKETAPQVSTNIIRTPSPNPKELSNGVLGGVSDFADANLLGSTKAHTNTQNLNSNSIEPIRTNSHTATHITKTSLSAETGGPNGLIFPGTNNTINDDMALRNPDAPSTIINGRAIDFKDMSQSEVRQNIEAVKTEEGKALERRTHGSRSLSTLIATAKENSLSEATKINRPNLLAERAKEHRVRAHEDNVRANINTRISSNSMRNVATGTAVFGLGQKEEIERLQQSQNPITDRHTTTLMSDQRGSRLKTDELGNLKNVDNNDSIIERKPTRTASIGFNFINKGRDSKTLATKRGSHTEVDITNLSLDFDNTSDLRKSKAVLPESSLHFEDAVEVPTLDEKESIPNFLSKIEDPEVELSLKRDTSRPKDDSGIEVMLTSDVKKLEALARPQSDINSATSFDFESVSSTDKQTDQKDKIDPKQALAKTQKTNAFFILSDDTDSDDLSDAVLASSSLSNNLIQDDALNAPISKKESLDKTESALLATVSSNKSTENVSNNTQSQESSLLKEKDLLGNLGNLGNLDQEVSNILNQTKTSNDATMLQEIIASAVASAMVKANQQNKIEQAIPESGNNGAVLANLTLAESAQANVTQANTAQDNNNQTNNIQNNTVQTNNLNSSPVEPQQAIANMNDIQTMYSYLVNVALYGQNAFEPAYPQPLNPYFQACHYSVVKTDYFTKRGISPLVILRFALGFDPNYQANNNTATSKLIESTLETNHSSLWQAVIIPTGESSYVARNTAVDCVDKIRRIGSARCFNLDALELDGNEKIFITSDEFDALSLESLGYSAIALGYSANAHYLLEQIRAKGHQNFHFYIALKRNDKWNDARLILEQGLQLLQYQHHTVDLCFPHEDINDALVKNRDALVNKLAHLDDICNIKLQDVVPTSTEQGFVTKASDLATLPLAPMMYNMSSDSALVLRLALASIIHWRKAPVLFVATQNQWQLLCSVLGHFANTNQAYLDFKDLASGSINSLLNKSQLNPAMPNLNQGLSMAALSMFGASTNQQSLPNSNENSAEVLANFHPNDGAYLIKFIAVPENLDDHMLEPIISNGILAAKASNFSQFTMMLDCSTFDSALCSKIAPLLAQVAQAYTVPVMTFTLQEQKNIFATFTQQSIEARQASPQSIIFNTSDRNCRSHSFICQQLI